VDTSVSQAPVSAVKITTCNYTNDNTFNCHCRVGPAHCP